MNIGKTIKRLRREQNMTQEKLAEYLNISPQAVSRWENELAMPELTLVPTIANLFGVTIDCLFGLDENDVNHAVELIVSKSADAENEADKNYVSLSILEDGVVRFPNNWNLKNLLLEKYYNTYVSYRDELEVSFLNNAIKYAEDILASCTDDGIRYSTIEILSSIYAICGDKEKAVSVVDRLPGDSATKDKLLMVLLDGDEKINKIKDNIESYAEMLTISLRTLAFSADFEPNEKLMLLKKIEGLYTVLFESDSDRESELMCDVHRYIAAVYADLGDAENTLKNLNREADILLLLNQGTEINPSAVRKEYGTTGTILKRNEDAYYLADELAYKVEHKRYDFVRDTEEFAVFSEKLDKILREE